MTDLQKKEFNILKTIIDICDKLDIKYYLVCGTALGAVKYQGFIPWDDDVDVALFRNDYERFLTEAPNQLPKKFFLQTFKSDSNYPNIFAKVRDCDTTYIEKSCKYVDMNHGIYVDVFPLDGYPSDKRTQRRVERCKKTANWFIFSPFDMSRSFHGKIATTFIRFLGLHKKANYVAGWLERQISNYEIKDNSLICNHGNWQGKLEYSPRWHYGNGTWATFEGLKVRIPENYDAYLTQKYGDWRADLPEDQKVGHHYYEVCDLTRPYNDYIEHLSNGRIRIKDLCELQPK